MAFARDPTQGLSKYGWPTYNLTTTSLIQLGGAANKTGVTFSQGQLADLSCGALDDLAALGTQLMALLIGQSTSKPA